MTIATQMHEVLRTVDLAASEPIVAVEQTFATSTADLWDACTTPARLVRWFEPVEGDLAIGGRYRLAGSGTEGTIEQCDPPSSLTVTWEHGGDASRVTLSIAEHASGATLTIRHVGADDEHWKTYGPAAGGMGWDEGLLALALHLDGDDRSELEALQALLATTEGRDFLAASADAWRAAHVAAGADEQDASIAAGRTLEAFTAMG